MLYLIMSKERIGDITHKKKRNYNVIQKYRRMVAISSIVGLQFVAQCILAHTVSSVIYFIYRQVSMTK